jgi:hypothetical protein
MQDVRISIQETTKLDKSSPFMCLKSMGLLTGPAGHRWPLEGINMDMEFSQAMSNIWTRVGGVDIALLGEPINIKKDEAGFTVTNGPRAVLECTKSVCSIHICKIRIVSGSSTINATAMFSVDYPNHIADVCIYDPKWMYSTALCYATANVKNWVRLALGPGWGVRVETLTETEIPLDILNAPHSVEYRKRFSRLWIFLICLLKTYFPHMTGSEISRSIAEDAVKNGFGLVSLLLTVLSNV